MKLALWEDNGCSTFVVSQTPGEWVTLDALGLRPRDTREAIELLADASQLTQHIAEQQARALPATGFRSPVSGRSKIIGVGRNYLEHAAEMGTAAPPEPILFTKWNNALAGPTDGIVVDVDLTAECDYEVELAVVIGRPTVNADLATATRSIFGFAVANDITARDLQRASKIWDRAKSFDTFCPIGPWLTTADEVEDWSDLLLQCTVNDDLVQEARAGQMIFGVPELISFISRGITLMPGDVILTGTPAGVAAGRRDNGSRYLQAGDVVRSTITGLGELQNCIVRA